MTLIIRLLGVEVFCITTDTEAPSPASGSGDATSMPVGFTATFERPDECGPPEWR